MKFLLKICYCIYYYLIEANYNVSALAGIACSARFGGTARIFHAVFCSSKMSLYQSVFLVAFWVGIAIERCSVQQLYKILKRVRNKLYVIFKKNLFAYNEYFTTTLDFHWVNNLISIFPYVD